MRRVALAAMFVLGACGDGGQPAPDARPDARLRGSPPSGCEEWVDDESQCARYETVCATVCGAVWDCCVRAHDDDGNETWDEVYVKCDFCPDAGVD